MRINNQLYPITLAISYVIFVSSWLLETDNAVEKIYLALWKLSVVEERDFERPRITILNPKAPTEIWQDNSFITRAM